MSAPILLAFLCLAVVASGATLFVQPIWELGDLRWLIVAGLGVVGMVAAFVWEHLRGRDERILQHANRIRQKRQAEAMRRLLKSPMGRFIDRDTFELPCGGFIEANIVRPRLSISERIGRWLRRWVILTLANRRILGRCLLPIHFTIWLAQRLGMKVNVKD